MDRHHTDEKKPARGGLGLDLLKKEKPPGGGLVEAAADDA